MTTRQPKAVCYVRVSSAAQVAKGHGAESQAARCEEYARIRGYNMVKTFADKAVSGSLTERPAMKELLSFLRQHRKDNVRVIIDDISRLARGVMTHFALRQAIVSAGGLLESPSREYGDDPEDDVLEIIEAVFAGEARRKNTEQTRNRQEARFLNGYYPFSPPWGYVSETRPGQGKVMIRKEPLASIIQEGLEGYASGLFQTQAEVKRFFEGQPNFPKTRFGTVTNETVKRILTRTLYAGMVGMPAWGVPWRQGHHEGLVSVATFEKIQERLKGKSYAAARPDLDAEFPLRGAVECAECDRPMTSSFSTSKTGAKHAYYMCFNKDCSSCRKSIRRDEIEGRFDTLLQNIAPSQKMVELFKAMFKNAWDMQAAHSQSLKRDLERKIATCDKDIAKLLDRIVDASNDTVIGAYETKLEKLEREKLVLAEMAENTGKPKHCFNEMFELALRFLANPYKIWNNEDIMGKKTVLRLVFSAPLSYHRKEGFRTPQTSSIFKALGAVNTGNFKMAERQGFEPWVRSLAQRFSRPPHSTTLAPLRTWLETMA